MKLLILFAILFNLTFANNILNKEQSPYLLQHKNDPIHWKPWSDKYINKSKNENKLIYLSIGYSTCHWCHVMQKESFKDKKIAQLLNKNFINIKIDKEEMPHIDNYFQDASSKLNNGKKGWPLNIILDQNKNILYINTYIPRFNIEDIKGFESVLQKFIGIKEDKQEIKSLTSINQSILKDSENNYSKKDDLHIKEFVEEVYKKYDKQYSGFDKNSKFIYENTLSLLLDIYLLEKNEKAYNIAIKTIDNILNSSTYDYIDGGFFRYSVSRDWNSPHFEKMLYTQANMIELLYKAHKITKNSKYKKALIKTVENVNTIFKTKNNLFQSALNAKEDYYLFDYEKAKKILINSNFNNYEQILNYLSFDDFGNYTNELNIVKINKNIKKPNNIKKAIKILSKVRAKKSLPFVDYKIITSWNAMMIKSLFIASSLDIKYLEEAKKSLDGLMNKLYINNQLYHQKVQNKKVVKIALLEDYANLVSALLQAYNTTLEKKYLSHAKKLHKYIYSNFYKNQKWYMDHDNNFEVIFSDKHYASDISIVFNNSLTIANLDYDLESLEKTKKMIKNFYKFFAQEKLESSNNLKAYIRSKNTDIIIKSTKKNLLKNSSLIQTIKYPFLLKHIEKSELFLACDEKSCFSYDKDINKVIKTIDKY